MGYDEEYNGNNLANENGRPSSNLRCSRCSQSAWLLVILFSLIRVTSVKF